MDSTMPESTSRITATRIKSKIQENEKFVLLAVKFHKVVDEVD